MSIFTKKCDVDGLGIDEHIWSKWEDVEEQFTKSSKGKIAEQFLIQKRECSRCGKKEFNKILMSSIYD